MARMEMGMDRFAVAAQSGAPDALFELGIPVSYTHLRAHETSQDLEARLTTGSTVLLPTTPTAF